MVTTTMNRTKHPVKFNMSKFSATVASSFVGEVPEFFYNGVEYFSTLDGLKLDKRSLSKLRGIGRYNLSSPERKKLVRSFSVTEDDFIKNMGITSIALEDFLEGTFYYGYHLDVEIATRFNQLQSMINEFTELVDFVYYTETPNMVIVVDALAGTILGYKKRFKDAKLIREDLDLNLVYPNGQVDLICEDGIFVDGAKPCGSYVSKGRATGYYKVFINGVEFRSHLVITALVYGVSILKHSIGRNGLLTIDHINKNGRDNRLENLRLVTRRDNTIIKENEDYRPFNFLWFCYNEKRKSFKLAEFIIK